MQVIFSDLHGHADRLRALLDRHPGAAFFCCGDVLGPTSHNQECVDLLRHHRVPTVQGNHEHQMWRHYAPTLHPAALSWIKSRPLQLTRGHLHVTHTRLERQASGGIAFWDVRSATEAEEAIHQHSWTTCIGHSHRPCLWTRTKQSAPTWKAGALEQPVELNHDCRYLVDVGSLGEGSPPSYVTLDGLQLTWRAAPEPPSRP